MAVDYEEWAVTSQCPLGCLEVLYEQDRGVVARVVSLWRCFDV